MKVRTVIPETMKKNNSKQALIFYRIKVCCNKEIPEEVYVFSFRRAGISLAVAAVCIAAAVWKVNI